MKPLTAARCYSESMTQSHVFVFSHNHFTYHQMALWVPNKLFLQNTVEPLIYFLLLLSNSDSSIKQASCIFARFLYRGFGKPDQTRSRQYYTQNAQKIELNPRAQCLYGKWASSRGAPVAPREVRPEAIPQDCLQRIKQILSLLSNYDSNKEINLAFLCLY